MMTFLILLFIGMTVAAVVSLAMLPLMLIGGILRLLTWPLRVLFAPRCWHVPFACGPGWGWSGRRWRRRGAFGGW
jgi:hypothetical protein